METNNQPSQMSNETPQSQPQQQYNNGQPQYNNGQPQYSNGQTQYNNGQPQYNNGQPQYNNGQSQYNNSQPQYNNGQPQYSNGQPQYNNVQSPYNNGQPPIEPKKKNTALWIGIAAAFLILAIAVGGYIIANSENKQVDEVTAYTALSESHSSKDYQAFLDQFPNSKFAADVRERMAKLLELEGAWNTIVNSSNPDDFANFKSKYNDDFYAKLADNKIDSLDFAKAQTAGTPAAFANYLQIHPEGRYTAEAQAAQSNAEALTITSDERSQVSETLNQFFSAFSENNQSEIAANITPVMTVFLGKKNATKAVVMSTIADMFNEHIQECRFNVGNGINITKKASNNGTIYSVDFSVDQYIERDNPGKTFGSYKAHAEINSNFVLSALTMKQISEKKQ
jgi:gas vesicle protein gvpC repeat-containing domain protein